MKILNKPCYNLDTICFINALTGYNFYIEYHKEDYDRFYPLLSHVTTLKLKEMVEKRGTSLLSSRITLLLSGLDNFETADLCEMLASHEDMRRRIHASPYVFTDEELTAEFEHYDNVIIPLIQELEAAGFRKYWTEEKLPLLQARCKILNNYCQGQGIYDAISNLKAVDKDATINMYICAFTRPIGIKLCGYNMISDYKWSDDIILATVTHEMFHPPYDYNNVETTVEKLGVLSWVKKAFDNQKEHLKYSPIKDFIEENIVEALGIYVLLKLGVETEMYKDPHKYFQEHDEGSHVVSPHFYDYLVNNPKPAALSFEDYFIAFADELIKGGV